MMMMKQSTLFPPLFSASFDEDEVEVAHILLDLKNLIKKSGCSSCLAELRRFRLRWGCTRRRSDRSFPPPPPPLRRRCSAGECEIKILPGVKTETFSPASPLSFSPSESDEKLNNSSRKLSKKKTKEELTKNIEDLSQRREILIEQLENVRAYYNSQMAYNLKLKETQQKLLGVSSQQEEQRVRVIGPYSNQAQRPIIFDPMGHRYEYQFIQNGPNMGLYSSLNGPGLMNYGVGPIGPIGIPDLNVSVDEMSFGVGQSQPFDLGRMDGDKRARYAEARKSRLIKNRLKIKSGQIGKR